MLLPSCIVQVSAGQRPNRSYDRSASPQLPRRSLLLLSLAITALIPTTTPSTGWAQEQLIGVDSFILEPGRAGPFIVGITVEELYQLVNHRSVSLVDLYGEGIFTPAAVFQLPGSTDESTITGHLAVLQCDRFRKWYLPYLEIRDPRFTTHDGIGVGSTLAEARELGWVDERGRAGPRAVDPEVRNFPRIRFRFEGLDRECESEGCPPPSDQHKIVVIDLLEPATRLQRRCAELRP